MYKEINFIFFCAYILVNQIVHPMEQTGVKLPVQSVLKFSNGTYATLTYNPFINLISQETKTAHGVVVGCTSLPLHNFKTNGPIKDVFPYGFVQLKDRLLAIAFATVRNKKDYALLFMVEDPSIPTVNYNSIFSNGEILDVNIMRSGAGNLRVSLLAQKDNIIGTVVQEFLGESINADKKEGVAEDIYVKINK